jgi:prepilin-type processing-associated H-X9-DG protein
MKQVGLACHSYESAHGHLPPQVTNSPSGGLSGWVITILPYIEQDAIRNNYDFSLGANQGVNRDLVILPINIFICPSVRTPVASRPNNMGGSPALTNAAPIDYQPYSSVSGGVYTTTAGTTTATRPVSYLNPQGTGSPPGIITGRLPPTSSSGPPTRLVNITDGTANTAMLTESSGRPGLFGPNGLMTGTAPTGAWGQSPSLQLTGSPADGSTGNGPCMINCRNTQTYSFHIGGAHMLFGDGSVRFAKASITADVMAAIVTREGGEALLPDF